MRIERPSSPSASMTGTTRVPPTPYAGHVPYDERDEAILAATQAELVAHGVLGLRVASVAEACGEPLSTIYRLFADREGLIATALLRAYNRRIDSLLEAARRRIDDPRPWTLEDVVALTPTPAEALEDNYRLTEQMLWLATEREAVAQDVNRERARQRRALAEILDEILSRLDPADRFDPRIYTMFIFNLSLAQNELTGEGAMGTTEYREFLLRLLRDSRPL